jgi:hypothetical protein
MARVVHGLLSMSDSSRSMKEGLAFGLIAGITFGVGSVLVSALSGRPALLPLRLAASVVERRDAFAMSRAGAIALGASVHIVLAGFFGLTYGFFATDLRRETRTGETAQAIVGAAFGAALWAVNLQVLARAFWPWFLDLPAGPVLVLHAACYGVPLGLLYALSERRTKPVQGPLAYR